MDIEGIIYSIQKIILTIVIHYFINDFNNRLTI
jgi:ABC-type cobalt transport system substrate-binding protein